MTATLALVGRPNVGKSTLFNRLTRSQDALVADFPGLTRDRQYGTGKVGGWPYIVVDTGGLSGEPESLDAAMANQTHAAIHEADLVVFIVDGREGLVPTDVEIAERLRRGEKRVLLCVNKIDGIGEDRAALEFHELGFERLVQTAASHNRGVHSMIDAAADMLDIDPALRNTEDTRKRRRSRKAQTSDESGSEVGADSAFESGRAPGPEPLPPREEDIRIGFVGRPNVGKSTLVNRLLGDERVIAYDKPGTTRDTVAVPFERNGSQYTLVDTAGIRRRGKVTEKVETFSIIKTLKAIEEANVCVMLIDASEGLTDQDLHLLSHIIDKGRALIVAVNKWDALNCEQRNNVKEALERRVEFLKFTRIHFISALKGSGVADLFKSIDKAHRSAFVNLSTPQLTRLLELAVTQHQPPMIAGRRIKLRYAHQGGVNPPIIVVHGRQADKVSQSYKRYLSNWFLKQLRLFGTPLRIDFRQGENPFAPRSGKARSALPGTKPESGKRSAGHRKREDSNNGRRGAISKNASQVSRGPGAGRARVRRGSK